MHAVVRRYSGAGAVALFNLLDERRSEVEQIIRNVPGFVGYSLMRTADGGVSVTVCEDKAGADQSLQLARDWVKNNATDFDVNRPEVAEGEVILHLG